MNTFRTNTVDERKCTVLYGTAQNFCRIQQCEYPVKVSLPDQTKIRWLAESVNQNSQMCKEVNSSLLECPPAVQEVGVSNPGPGHVCIGWR